MSQGELVDGRWPVVVDAEAAYEAIRSINHRTIWLSDGLPAPAVYWVLAELKSALGYSAQQTLEQLGRGLAQSLDHYEVYEDDGVIRRRQSRLRVRHCRLPRTSLGKLAYFWRAPSSRLPARGIGPCPSGLMSHEVALRKRCRPGVASWGLFPDRGIRSSVAAPAPGSSLEMTL